MGVFSFIWPPAAHAPQPLSSPCPAASHGPALAHKSDSSEKQKVHKQESVTRCNKTHPDSRRKPSCSKRAAAAESRRSRPNAVAERAHACAANLQHDKGYAVRRGAAGILLSDSAGVGVEQSAQFCDNDRLAHTEEKGQSGKEETCYA